MKFWSQKSLFKSFHGHSFKKNKNKKIYNKKKKIKKIYNKKKKLNYI